MDNKNYNVSSDIIKVTQALGFLLSLDDNHKMNRVKLIKILWAADRIHIRKYGRTITGLDDYYAIEHGPICSLALDIARVTNIQYDGVFSEDEINYLNDFFTCDSKHTSMQKNPGNDYLSDSDEEALREAWNKFKDKKAFDLADDISHRYPEWSKHEIFLNEGYSRRKKIDTEDFFNNPSDDEYFYEDDERLKAAHEIYKENKKASACLKAIFGVR